MSLECSYYKINRNYSGLFLGILLQVAEYAAMVPLNSGIVGKRMPAQLFRNIIRHLCQNMFWNMLPAIYYRLY
jgi:hypothetical protein